MRICLSGSLRDLFLPLAILIALVPSCGGSVAPPPLSGPSGAGTTGSCSTGDLGCMCYANQTCNAPLDCLAGVCTSGTGSGGTSSGSGGSSSRAGNGGSSSMGASSNGGSGAGTGNGGSTASGGTESTSAGTGGSQGSGGSAGSSSTVPGNLLSNGDFSDGTTNWEIKLQASTLETEPVTNGALCITLTSDQFYTVGWPAAPNPGVAINASRYVFSYQASATGPLPLMTFTVKVGGAMLPYQTDFEQVDMVTSQTQTFSDPFTPALGADPDAGVVFQIQAGYSVTTTDSVQVCLDNVSLAPG